MSNERNRKHQRGSIWLRGASFYIRYYGHDRRQRTEFLCKRDDKHHSKTCRPVKDLASKVMSRVNSGALAAAEIPTVAEFWDGTYLPFAEKNLRPSTVHSYKDLWDRHIKPHFGDARLTTYKSSDATAFLTSLSSKLGRNSVNHVRSLMSGIFSHACALGKAERNPMREAKVLGKPKATMPTQHYTLEETENIISALAGDAEAQSVMALSCFMGLRPSEIAGLDWSDVTESAIHIRRAFVRGIIGPTKTPESVASLPLVAPVKIPLALWHKQRGTPEDGWVFPNAQGLPFHIREFTRQRIRPKLKAGQWKGLYSGRRGAATILVGLTGSLVPAQELLRHKSLTTTAMFYKKTTASALADGLKLLEAATARSK
jgi:integrase